MTEKNGSKRNHLTFDSDDLTHLPRTDADKGREPEMLSSHLGTRRYSMSALVERIVLAFNTEHGEESPAYQEAVTHNQRLKLLRDTVSYVLSVESIQLSAEDKGNVIARAFSELFGYGPLDPFFDDDRVTTIALDGMDKVAVRYGHGEFQSVGPLFDDMYHFLQVIGRLLKHAGAELRENQPYIETGLAVRGRPVSMSLVTLSVAAELSADIRVHPRTLPTLDQLVEAGFLTKEAATFLRALVRSPHGFMVVGESESGKTILLSVLAQMLPQGDGVISVERAGELRLPAGAQCLKVQWPVGEQSGTTFGEQLGAALEQNPQCIILDEVRADEPETIAPLLASAEAPRQIWGFRGPANSKRLRSALGMLAQRANTEQGEALAQALYKRLPFVITVTRGGGNIHLQGISEWQFQPGSDYPDYVDLIEMGWEGLEQTGKQPAHNLDLPDDFWMH